jgi:hypothetical protein
MFKGYELYSEGIPVLSLFSAHFSLPVRVPSLMKDGRPLLFLVVDSTAL